jgi:TonB family protein
MAAKPGRSARWRWLVLIACLGAGSALAAPSEPPSEPPSGPRSEPPAVPARPAGPVSASGEISGLRWLRRPDGGDLERYYPALARDQGLGGRAVLQCVVRADGTLGDCFVLEENPAGVGFGEATILAAGKLRVGPATPGGRIEGAKVVVPIVWTLADESAPRLPIAFEGWWVGENQRCRAWAEDSQIVIGPTSIRFYAGEWAVTAVRQQTPRDAMIALRAGAGPEAESRVLQMQLSADGQRLTEIADGERFVRKRCRGTP